MPKKPVFLVGLGSDDHKIIPNGGNEKPVVLAGVIVSMEYSPAAHSDGDVVYHAIANALLLAVGERDIGYHFPDTNPAYRDMPGGKILAHALGIVRERGYRANNVTVMVTALRPRIGPYVAEMKRNIADALGIGQDCVGVGATTGEGLSAHGRGEGINVVAQISLREGGEDGG